MTQTTRSDNIRRLMTESGVYCGTESSAIARKEQIKNIEKILRFRFRSLLEHWLERISASQDPKKCKQYVSVLEFELREVSQLGCSEDFLFFLDLGELAREQEVRFGPGVSGSGSSLLLFLLGFVDRDPVPYRLDSRIFLHESGRFGRKLTLTIAPARLESFLNALAIRFKRSRVGSLYLPGLCSPHGTNLILFPHRGQRPLEGTSRSRPGLSMAPGQPDLSIRFQESELVDFVAELDRFSHSAPDAKTARLSDHPLLKRDWIEHLPVEVRSILNEFNIKAFEAVEGRRDFCEMWAAEIRRSHIQLFGMTPSAMEQRSQGKANFKAPLFRERYIKLLKEVLMMTHWEAECLRRYMSCLN